MSCLSYAKYIHKDVPWTRRAVTRTQFISRTPGCCLPSHLPYQVRGHKHDELICSPLLTEHDSPQPRYTNIVNFWGAVMLILRHKKWHLATGLRHILAYTKHCHLVISTNFKTKTWVCESSIHQLQILLPSIFCVNITVFEKIATSESSLFKSDASAYVLPIIFKTTTFR